MASFDNGKTEEFLLFIHNFNMTLKVSVTLKAGAKITLVRGKSLCQFDVLSSESERAITDALTYNILGLRTYFFPVNAMSTKKCVMRCVMRKPRGLKLRRHTSFLVYFNDHLVVFPGGKISNIICVTDLNETLLKSMPNNWSN